MKPQNDKAAGCARWVWLAALAALVLSPALLALLFALGRAGLMPEGMWAWNVVVITPVLAIAASALAFVAASALWLSNRFEFRAVRATLGISALGVVVNYLLTALIFSRYVRF